MKTMKIWRLAFAMLAALSLASCSSDAAMMTISLMQANLKESGEKPYEVALWMERR